jgi:protein-tyrosine phosphatase
VIDLHCHILPSLDDGPADLEGSLQLARRAVDAGTSTIAATPHIREDYPFDPEEIAPRVERLNADLVEAGLQVEVVPGGELAFSRLPELDDETLARITLGDSSYLLMESPYGFIAEQQLERDLFDLQVRGFRPVLAHPERCPSFHQGIERLAGLVEHGVVCAITVSSMTGRFGRTVRRFTAELFRAGLVHVVTSDAHDAGSREPDLRAGFRAWDSEQPGILALSEFFTRQAPAAILADDDVPKGPQLGTGRRRPRRFWRRSLD